MIDTCDTDTHALQRAVKIFLPLFFEHQTNSTGFMAGLFGASSSAVSIQTASLMQIFKVPQVSPWSTHPDLSNKNRFPYFFRTVPSDAFQAKAILSLVKMSNWNYVSIIYEDDLYGTRGRREIQNLAAKEGVCIALSLAIQRNPTFQNFNNTVKKLLTAKKAKAVIIFAKSNDAEMLIEAAHANPESRGYFQWIGSDGWSGQLPTITRRLSYDESLKGAITFKPKTRVIPQLKDYMAKLTLGQHLAVNQSSKEIRNPWFPEFISHLKKCTINPTNSSTLSDQSICSPDITVDKSTYTTLSKMQNVADAILAFVAALKQYNREKCGESKVCNFTNSDENLATKIFPYMKNVSFRGINGDMQSFDANQDGPAVYDIQQYKHNSTSNKNEWQIVGIYRNNGITLYSNVESNTTSVCSQPCKVGQAKKVDANVCCWLCQTCLPNQYVGVNGSSCMNCPVGTKPNINKTGCVSITLKYSQFSSGVNIASVTIAVVGILLTLAVAVVFFHYRDSAIVKASGKELCVFVLLGAILCFLDSFVLSLKSTDVTCATSRIIVAIGPTMMYSGLLTKTIRVVIIFQSKTFLSSQVKTFLQPKFQILTTFALIFLQIFIVTVWFAISPPKATIIYPNPDEAFLSCKGIENLFIIIGLAYPFVLILVCTILATVNRNVPTGFKETQYVGFTMYATCVIWLAFLPIFITNASNIELKIATLAICLSLSAFTVIICLFVIRCFVILFHPEQNNSKSVMSTSNVVSKTNNVSSERQITTEKISEARSNSGIRSSKIYPAV